MKSTAGDIVTAVKDGRLPVSELAGLGVSLASATKFMTFLRDPTQPLTDKECKDALIACSKGAPLPCSRLPRVPTSLTTFCAAPAVPLSLQ